MRTWHALFSLHRTVLSDTQHHDPFAPDAAEKLEYAISQQGLRGIKIFGRLRWIGR